MSASKFTTLLLFLLCIIAGKAQPGYDLSRFTGIRSHGEIPADIRKDLAQLYSEDKQRVREYNDGKLTNRDQVLAVSYHISRLTSNGRILYGDPITRMIEDIADTLLQNYPTLRRELRFYTVKSPSVNAFATGQGMIFVNLGLVAQVQDEAQLAFVISHEIIHYYRNHATEMLTRRQRKDDDLDIQLEEFLRYHNRSHAMEREADSLGLKLFYMNSPFDQQVCEGIFDVLQYAALPFFEIPLERGLFDSPYYRIPQNYYLDTVAPVTSRDDYDDSRSNHPNIKKRRAVTGNMMYGRKGGSRFVTRTAEQFAHLRDLARFECIRQELIYADYSRAFYDSHTFLRQYPGNEFLTQSCAQALYSMARHMSTTNTTQCVGDYNDYEGEIQQCYYLFKQFTPEQMSILAMRQLWLAHQQFPSNQHITNMCHDMMSTIIHTHKLSPSHFAATFNTALQSHQTIDPNDKYARLRQKKVSNLTYNTRYAFTDFLAQDSSFAKFMSECLKEDTTPTDGHQRSTFIFAPNYVVVENNEAYDIKYRKSDQMEQKLTTQVITAAQAAGLSTVNFSDPVLRSHTDDAFYNDFVTLNEWTNEFWNSRGKVRQWLSVQPMMDSLNLRYGADLLGLNMVANLEYYYNFGLYPLLLSAITLPVTPYLAHTLLTGNEHTLTHNLLIDTRQGSIVSQNQEEFVLRDSPAIVEQEVFENLHSATGIDLVSGHLGHRFAVNVGLGLRHTLFYGLTNELKKNGLDLSYMISLEYATRQRQSINLWGDYTNSSYAIPSNYYFYGHDHSQCIYNGSLASAALTYRFYGADYAAPHGTYFGIGYGLHSLNLAPATEGITTNPLSDHYLRHGLQLEWGRNLILGERYMLSFGVRHAILFCNPVEKVWDNDFDYDNFYRTNAERMLNANLWLDNLAIFHFTLGFLPF